MSEDVKEVTELDVNIGQVKFSGESNGHYSGCLVEGFAGNPRELAEQLNKYAATHPERLIVNMTPLMGGMLVGYTVTMDDDELWVLRNRHEVVQEEVQKRIADENSRRKKEVDLKAQMDEELKRLAKLGQKCEQNHKKAKKGKGADADS